MFVWDNDTHSSILSTTHKNQAFYDLLQIKRKIVKKFTKTVF